MIEKAFFKTKRTGVINEVVVGSVTHKRILAESENYEQVSGPAVKIQPEPPKPENKKQDKSCS